MVSSIMRHLAVHGFLAGGMMVACDGPGVSDLVARAPPTATLSGRVSIRLPEALSCGHQEIRGPAILLLYGEDLPTPRMLVIPESKLFPVPGVTNYGALLNLNYVFPQVEVGTRYYLQVIMDGDRNFSPLHAELAQPSSGDIVGMHVDENNNPSIIEVGDAGVYAGISVVVETMVAKEPPSFRLIDTEAQPGGFFTVVKQALDMIHISQECLDFRVRTLPVENSPRDLDQDGLVVYPRVTLRSEVSNPGDPVLIYEGEVDVSGVGELPALAHELRVRLPNDIPPGLYRVTVDSGDGQHWTVPNQLYHSTLGIPLEQLRGLQVLRE